MQFKKKFFDKKTSIVLDYLPHVIEIHGSEPVSVIELNQDDKQVGFIHPPSLNVRVKVYNAYQIQILPVSTKGSYELTLTESKPELDKTPVETPVEQKPMSHAQMKAQMMNQLKADYELKAFLEGKESFAEFTDLEMEDELPDLFEQHGITPAEAISEAIRQSKNPFRGGIDEKLAKDAQKAAEELSKEESKGETGKGAGKVSEGAE